MPIPVDLKRPCDLCGDIGYSDFLVTCSICQTSNEHLYCMRKNLFRMPEKWFCEACSDNNKKRMGSPILGSPPKRAARSVLRNMKVAETGKVKFLPAEDARMLSSGSRTKASTIWGRLGPQTCWSKTLNYSPSKRNTISVAEASKRFSQMTSSHRSSGPSKPSVREIGQSSSSLQHRVAKTPPQSYNEKSPLHSPSYRSPPKCSGGPMEREAKEKPKMPQLLGNADAKAYRSRSSCSRPLQREPKEKPREPQLLKNADAEAYPSSSNCYGLTERLAEERTKEPQLLRKDKPAGKEDCMSPNKELVCKDEPVHGSLLAKEEGSPEHASSPPAKAKIFSRFEGLPDHLGINAAWKGGFEILDTVSTGELYEGLHAHPPGKIRRRAYEASKEMPKMLPIKLHPRCDVWPEIFNIDCPTGNDIALYFLPGGFDSKCNEKYASLVNLIETRDLAMRSCLNGVELLIFTSKQLPADSQRINMKFYLWGFFRSVKKQLCSSSKVLMRSGEEEHDSLCSYSDVIDPLNVSNGDNTEGVDMEIDMIGGKEVGRIDKPVQKPNLEEKKIQFKLMAPKSKRNCINSNVLDYRKDLVVSAPQPLSIVKMEQLNELDAPPGFPKLVTSDAADKCLLGAPPGFSNPLTPEGRGDSNASKISLLGAPPGFSKPLIPKEKGDSGLLGAPPGFSKPLTPKEMSDSCPFGAPPGFPKPFTPKEMGDSEKRSSSTDTSKDIKGSTLQPQKAMKVSKSPEFPGKCHQVAMNRSVTADLKPLSEKGRKGLDAIQKDVIQCDSKDGLLSFLPRSFQLLDDSKAKTNVRGENFGATTEHEMKKASTKPKLKTVAECLQLFPNVEQLESNAKLKLGSSGNKLVEDKDPPVLSLSRPLYVNDGQRWITSISKERLQKDGCDDDVKLTL